MAFLLALETGMRAGEIINLTWDRVYLDERYVRLQSEYMDIGGGRTALTAKTKNGDSRDVPLSRTAVQLLSSLPRGEATCFDLKSAVCDTLFRKARDRCGIKNLHFHDSRATALTRLAKRLHVLELARMIGHRNPSSLMIYYRESASSLAEKLD
jgi:integrase